MSRIDIPIESLTGRRRTEQVLELPESGPSSRGSTYWRRVLSCPREHLLSNELSWAHERRTDALEFGLLWHYTLEKLYTNLHLRQLGQPHEEPTRAAAEVVQRFVKEPGWEKGYETISRMLNAYIDRWWERDQKEWQILGVECAVEVGIQDGFGFPYSTRLDLLVIDHKLPRDPVGRSIEHKSAYALTGDVLTGYQQDQQILGQVWLAERCVDWDAYGVPYMGALVNITTKSDSDKKAIENERMLVHPTREQLDAWESSMVFWERWRGAISVDASYPRNYAACSRRWGRCEFFTFCQSQPDVDAVMLREHARLVGSDAAVMPPGLRVANRFDEE